MAKAHRRCSERAAVRGKRGLKGGHLWDRFRRARALFHREKLGAELDATVEAASHESLILSSIAAAGGLIFAYWRRNLLVLLLPRRSGTAMSLPGAVDRRVLVLSAVVCLLATLLVGLVPAIHTGKLDLASAMRSPLLSAASTSG